MFAAITRLATTRPRRVLGVTALFFVLAGVIGGPVAGLLNTDNDSFSDTGAASAEAIRQVEKASGQKASPDVVVLVDAAATSAIEQTRTVLDSTVIRPSRWSSAARRVVRSSCRRTVRRRTLPRSTGPGSTPTRPRSTCAGSSTASTA